MDKLPFNLIALSLLVVGSCTSGQRTTLGTPATKPQPEAVSATPAERFVQALDRSSPRLPSSSWAAIEPEATALGITTPPSPDVWQQILTASLQASTSTQWFLINSAKRFGDAYSEAASKTLKAGACNLWIRITCLEWEIERRPDQKWAAESVLRFTQEVLANPEAEPPPSGRLYGNRAEDYWTEVELPRMWYVPEDAKRNRTDLLAWVNRALSNREVWYYSREHKLWISQVALPAPGNGGSSRSDPQ